MSTYFTGRCSTPMGAEDRVTQQRWHSNTCDKVQPPQTLPSHSTKWSRLPSSPCLLVAHTNPVVWPTAPAASSGRLPQLWSEQRQPQETAEEVWHSLGCIFLVFLQIFYILSSSGVGKALLSSILQQASCASFSGPFLILALNISSAFEDCMFLS